MVTISASGTVQAKDGSAQPEHTIFKICLRCHYNTLKPSECSAFKSCGPGYRCPECQKSTFVPACTVCRFDNSLQCPLTQLLNTRPKATGHERRGRERYRKGEHRENEIEESLGREPATRRPELCPRRSLDAPDMKKQCQDILKKFKKNGGKVHTAPQVRSSEKTIAESPTTSNSTATPRPQPKPEIPESPIHVEPSQNPTISPQPPAPLKALPIPLETPQTYCSQCSQARCQTCRPGYMNLIVDMKEFSVTFASEMALCTMCEHWLCPGSSLIVLYRCRECGHEGCESCENQDDGLGEEWVVCCACAKMGSEN